MSDRGSITEAKQRLPLPVLMQRLNLGDHAKKNALCPFHPDKNKSFSIWKDKRGAWAWKCHTGCGGGDEIKFIERHRDLAPGKGVRPYLEMAGVTSLNGNGKKEQSAKKPPFDWSRCLGSFKPSNMAATASDRKYSLEFVTWLHAQRLIGMHEGQIAFPIFDERGAVVACHYKPSWVGAPDWLVHRASHQSKTTSTGTKALRTRTAKATTAASARRSGTPRSGRVSSPNPTCRQRSSALTTNPRPNPHGKPDDNP